MWDHLFCFFEQYYLWLFGIDFIKDKKYDLEFQNKYLEIAVKKTYGWSIDPPKKISVNTKHAFLHINAVPHRNHPFGIFIRGDYLARKLKQTKAISGKISTLDDNLDKVDVKWQSFGKAIYAFHRYENLDVKLQNDCFKLGLKLYEDAFILESHHQAFGDNGTDLSPTELPQDFYEQRFVYRYKEIFEVLLKVRNTPAVRSPFDFLNFIYYCEHYRVKGQESGERSRILGKLSMLVTGCGFMNTLGRSLFHDMINSVLLSFKCEILGMEVPVLDPAPKMSHISRILISDPADHASILAFRQRSASAKTRTLNASGCLCYTFVNIEKLYDGSSCLMIKTNSYEVNLSANRVYKRDDGE